MIQPTSISSLPGISIIICVHNEARNIHTYLQALLSQDYPHYEVILVNNCSQDASRDEIEDYMMRDPRVRLTQIPEAAWTTNVRRLALTLAARAAHFDYLLFINPDCRPQSRFWLRRMMESMLSDSRVEMVLGMSGFYRRPTLLNRWSRFMLGLDEWWVRVCLRLHAPRRGKCRNYLCTKALYFRSLNDRFVLWPWNTVVCKDPDARVWSRAAQTWTEWFQHKYLYHNGRKKIGY